MFFKEDEIAALILRLSQADGEIARLTEELNLARCENENLRKEICRLQDEICELQAELERLHHEYKHVLEELHQAQLAHQV